MFCDNNLINSRDFGDFLKQAFQYLEGFPMRIAVCCLDEKSSKHICDFLTLEEFQKGNLITKEVQFQSLKEFQ